MNSYLELPSRANEVWKMGERMRLLDYRWRIGVPSDFWIIYAKNVQRFIETNKLQPMPSETLGSRVANAEMKERMMADYPWWWRFGGMKAPHLHYGGELYVLNKQQWNDFTSQIVKEFSEKLAGAKAVSFSHLMDLSEALNEIV